VWIRYDSAAMMIFSLTKELPHIIRPRKPAKGSLVFDMI